MGSVTLWIHLKQAGHLDSSEKLTRERLLSMLEEKIRTIDWENAKSDMQPFIADMDALKIWSSQYFLSAIEYLQVE